MKDMKIFIISGKARHGKTTVANYINELLGNCAITSYSRYIKMYASDVSDWDGTDENKPRRFLQDIGNFVRNGIFDDEFFIRRIDEDIKVYALYKNNAIVDDARLPMEIDYFKERYSNVYSIRVVRSNFDNGLSIKEKHHETEVALDNYSNYDYTIVNDGSLSDLRDKVDKCLESLL